LQKPRRFIRSYPIPINDNNSYENNTENIIEYKIGSSNEGAGKEGKGKRMGRG
jgi:hypothetical protein